MRELTLKSYLERQMCELSGASGKSLYRFSAMCKQNARLRDAVVLYLLLFTKKDLKSHLIKKYPYLSEDCAKLSNIMIESLENNLSDPALSEYKTIYDNYLARKNNKANEDMDELISILNEIGLPYAYDHFAEGESPNSPFICYLLPCSDNFAADGMVYYKINDVHIELYTDYKNTELELKVEEVLDRHNIFYNKSEVWIDSEKLYEVMYSYEIWGTYNAEEKE